MKVLLIDNYDSFTYNLVHAIEPWVDELVVWRNDAIRLENVPEFDKIVFSPGPSLPVDAGQMMDIISQFHDRIPMLGVCLGFQAIVEFFDGELINLYPVRHGETAEIHIHDSENLFKNLAPIQTVGLYHSWGVESKTLPNILENLASDSSGISMAFKHRELPIYGVQFHPESVMTPHGNEMIKNWVLRC